jgi:hypothetical protein
MHLTAALLYVFVLLGSAFLHHDFACHEKSRTHCTSCVFSQLSAGIQAEAPPPAPPAPDLQLLTQPVAPVVSAARLFFGTDSSPPLA